MVDIPILVSPVENTPESWQITAAQQINPKSITASFDGTGAGGSFVPTLRILDANGNALAECPIDTTLAAGASADVSWFPFVKKKTGLQPSTPQYNVNELGFVGEGTHNSFATCNLTLGDVAVGDGILVLGMAPSNDGGGGPEGFPDQCFDTAANTYFEISTFNWQDSPSVANTGIFVSIWWCPSSIAPMVTGVDFIRVLWNHNVNDRVIYAHGVRHDGGASQPQFLAATADHDAATFASNQMTLTAPNYTPPRNNGLELAFLCSAKLGGVGGFGGVGGYSGFFQDTGHSFVGSFQTYLINWQTHGAVVLIDPTTSLPTNEKDFGTLPGGTLVPSFNGVAQFYSSGNNAWKGIALYGAA